MLVHRLCIILNLVGWCTWKNVLLFRSFLRVPPLLSVEHSVLPRADTTEEDRSQVHQLLELGKSYYFQRLARAEKRTPSAVRHIPKFLYHLMISCTYVDFG